MDHEAKLKELGLQLPARAPAPVANYVPARQVGELLYVSGQGPTDADGKGLRGKVGVDVDIDEARRRAQLTALNILAVVHEHCGLGRVAAVVKLLGMVNAPPDFSKHPTVIDGCSDLLVHVFGPEIGAHARSAVGLGSLPGGITVEIEAIFALKP